MTAAFLLPRGPVKNRLLRWSGCTIGADAIIHPVLVLGVERVVVGDHAYLGLGNIIRDLRLLQTGDHSIIGHWNWISAARALDPEGVLGSLRLGAHSAITARHYIDASGSVTVGDFTTVAGVRSTIVTHGIDWRSNAQRTKPVTIGDRCLVGSNCSITPGSTVPDGSVIGMGVTIGPGLTEAHALYLAPRAARVKSGLDGGYFTRDVGAVAPVDPLATNPSETAPGR